MVERTSTEIAPWTLVEANDKYYARIKVLKTLADRDGAAAQEIVVSAFRRTVKSG